MSSVIHLASLMYKLYCKYCYWLQCVWEICVIFASRQIHTFLHKLMIFSLWQWHGLPAGINGVYICTVHSKHNLLHIWIDSKDCTQTCFHSNYTSTSHLCRLYRSIGGRLFALRQAVRWSMEDQGCTRELRHSAEKLMTKHRHLHHVNTTNKMSPSAESRNVAG